MRDSFEAARRARLAEISAKPRGQRELEAAYGQVWDTQELTRDYEILGFLAPFVAVWRKADGVLGSLEFQASPRFYFAFQADQGEVRTWTGCGWCHTLNETTTPFCRSCGHEAQVARMHCRCPRCTAGTPAASGEQVTTVAEAVEEVLAELKRRQASGE